MDVAIPIAFPDYLIAVKTAAKELRIPLTSRTVTIIPATKQKVPHLGHAGVLFIDGKSGLTKYSEYGRYDAAEKGWTRSVAVPDVVIVKGKPTRKSLIKTLARISEKAGQN